MRQLGIHELEDKSDDYFSTVEYANHDEVKDKLTQLMNFLYSQDIARNILERIQEDYHDLYIEVEPLEDKSSEKSKKEVIDKLLTPDHQGAFGYFLIDKKFKEERKYSRHYIDLPWFWYGKGHSAYEQHESFNSYFLKPFKELYDWYLYESQPKNDSDYFSKESQEKIFAKLEELEQMLTKLGYGQEIVFEEVDDLKKLTNKLNQKNWKEIIKGKFIDMVPSGIISHEVAIKTIEFLTGTDLKLLS